MATSPAERQQILADLSTVAIRDLVELWRNASRFDADFAALILGAFPEITSAYAGIAAGLAAQWYDEAAPQLAYAAVLAPNPKAEALDRSARWALGADGEMALNRMSGTLQRAVFDGARDTTILNVRNEVGSRWARYASANACPFCRMQATRGAVYASKATALKAHGSCHCVAIEVRPGDSYSQPSYVEEWEAQYADARKLADSSDTKAIQAAWRRMIATA